MRTATRRSTSRSPTQSSFYLPPWSASRKSAERWGVRVAPEAFARPSRSATPVASRAPAPEAYERRMTSSSMVDRRESAPPDSGRISGTRTSGKHPPPSRRRRARRSFGELGRSQFPPAIPRDDVSSIPCAPGEGAIERRRSAARPRAVTTDGRARRGISRGAGVGSARRSARNLRRGAGAGSSLL